MPDTKVDTPEVAKRKEPTEPEEPKLEQSPKKSKTEVSICIQPSDLCLTDPPMSQALPPLETFLELAHPLNVTLSNDYEDAEGSEVTVASLVAKPIKMSTGSYGWSTTGKAKVRCGEEEIPVQISINIVVPGSKNQSQENEETKE
ncbi:hypothetical protein K493DRAFT_303866 [Basidiobolus meristosporus CBS 931.73]|uniref:Uncharacterized protein n=1 Tax=Basidiobolus meristosporus CBS 931.73 TaxID=1314790 RepID=A0A1Y1Y154_9FUNG|nr:hypothetical protein K493DRAFT_303866 [Basidiobolus meristosporus CBS 931.73]|eukprot:ORX91733.1 hypothetical protein K493DRAFT_303866 [Basidiobolus meristosporus CBS 931.73]